MTLALLLLLGLVVPAASDAVFRDDFATLDGWEPRPDWLAARATQPVAEVREGVAHFAIREASRGLKWRRELPDVDFDLTPWLVIRYRGQGYQPQLDYVVWLGDSSRGRDGVKLLRVEDLKLDGQWHAQAVDLRERGVVGPLRAVAVQCHAAATGQAELWVDYLEVTDSPPAEADGYLPPTTGGQRVEVAVTDPAAWRLQPGWLNNPTARPVLAPTAAGVRFAVPDAGRGAKWSRDLPAPVEGCRWVSLRYRASRLGAGADYALYVAGAPGGAAAQEQYLVQLNDVVADGDWHVAVRPVEVPTIRTLAIQVQAAGPAASLEIGRLTFCEQRPSVALAETVDLQAGWGAARVTGRPLDLPPGNTDAATLARRLGYVGDLASGEVTASGVAFRVRGGQDTAAMTSVREPTSLEVPLSGRGAELYLLLAAQLPASEEPSFPGPGGLIRQVDRLVARVEYADGAEEQFPWFVNAAQHVVSQGVHVYALALDPGRELRRLTLRDGMRRGAFGLLAATLSDQPGPATAATAVKPAVVVPTARPVAARRLGLTVTGAQVQVEADSVAVTLDARRGLAVSGVVSHAGVNDPFACRPGPLFRLQAGERTWTSQDFRTVAVSQPRPGTARFDLALDAVTPPAKVSVDVMLEAGREVAFAATADFGQLDPATTRFFFPELAGVRCGPADEDTWYWLPRQGDVISNVAATLREPYSGRAPLQVCGAYGPRAGCGVYLLTQDLEAVPRWTRISKAAGQVDLGLEYWPARSGAFPRTVLGCHQGDWHVPFERYRDWVATWYRPAASRKPWFREVFNFRQQFLTFTLPTASGLFTPADKAFHFGPVLARDREAFGGLDYLHLFDWGWDPVHGRCGDYQPWDYLGPPEAFRAALDGVQRDGVPVGLYIEGVLVDPQSKLGQAKGAAWQLLDLQGEPYQNFAPSFHICPAVKDWQEYLAGTYARAKAQTGARGFYIDQFGFSYHYWCTNPGHGHAVPTSPVLGERAMLQRVRAALGPDSVIYTEESPTDVNSQYQDGSFTYHISSTREALSPSAVNLYRFAFPSFKTIEIIVCDKPLGSNVEAVKRVLFNGEGIWLEGIADRWFEPETLAAIRTMHRVLRANRECFAGDWPTPLVPTLVDGVFANRFASRADEGGKTCWTIANTTFRTLRAPVITVAHTSGATYRDEVTGQALTPRVAGDEATLTIEVGPRDVVVVSRTRP